MCWLEEVSDLYRYYQKKKKKTQRSAYSMNARSPMNPFSKAKEKLDFRSVSN